MAEERCPREFVVPVVCGQPIEGGSCKGVIHAYDTRSHEEVCPKCGRLQERVSTPLAFLAEQETFIQRLQELLEKSLKIADELQTAFWSAQERNSKLLATAQAAAQALTTRRGLERSEVRLTFAVGLAAGLAAWGFFWVLGAIVLGALGYGLLRYLTPSMASSYEESPWGGHTPHTMLAALRKSLVAAPLPQRETTLDQEEWYERYSDWWEANASPRVLGE